MINMHDYNFTCLLGETKITLGETVTAVSTLIVRLIPSNTGAITNNLVLSVPGSGQRCSFFS